MKTVNVIFIGYFVHTSTSDGISYITNCYQAIDDNESYYEQGSYGLVLIIKDRVNSSGFVSCDGNISQSYKMKIWK